MNWHSVLLESSKVDYRLQEMPNLSVMARVSSPFVQSHHHYTGVHSWGAVKWKSKHQLVIL